MLTKLASRTLPAGLAGALLLCGCASPFALFYDPARHAHPAAAVQQAEPVLELSRDPDADGRRLAQEGFVLIGSSFFFGSALTDHLMYRTEAVAQGMKLGATLVLLDADYNDVVADGCCVRLFASYWTAADHAAAM